MEEVTSAQARAWRKTSVAEGLWGSSCPHITPYREADLLLALAPGVRGAGGMLRRGALAKASLGAVMTSLLESEELVSSTLTFAARLKVWGEVSAGPCEEPGSFAAQCPSAEPSGKVAEEAVHAQVQEHCVLPCPAPPGRRFGSLPFAGPLASLPLPLAGRLALPLSWRLAVSGPFSLSFQSAR